MSADTTFAGILTMARHEFRLRLRAGRWRWVLGAWFVALALLLVMLRISLVNSGEEDVGTPMLGGLMLLVLSLALLVVPALTAQSVNGDRERGVLATLQTTLLSPLEIALGKLLAAWGTALVFLAVTLPLIGWCMLEGGVAIGRVAIALLVVALLLGVVCAVCQCLSALLARSTTSAVLSYVFVFAITIGTLVVFTLSLAATTEEREVRQRRYTYTGEVAHPERVWWLLAPNPFVILADAAPRVPPELDRRGREFRTSFDPLGEMGDAVREIREPDQGDAFASIAPGDREPGGAVWPYGLAFHVALGVGAVALTERRLRTPYRSLPRAVRVA